MTIRDMMSCCVVRRYSFNLLLSPMLVKLNSIILYMVITFCVALVVYPFYIRFLHRLKAWKTIRDHDVMGQKASIFQSLHGHKAWTPTMGGGIFLVIVLLMIIWSFVIQYMGYTNNTLRNREETYILLFGFFSMGIIGLIDDILNIRDRWRVKWLSAWAKMLGMTVFASFITYRFYVKLGVDRVILWPWSDMLHLWWLFIPCSFFLTLFITHAINITDGLDGLAGGMMAIVLSIIAVVMFTLKIYIATTLVGVIISILIAFLRFNINPAKIFMGDSGAFSLGGLISVAILLLNMRVGIMIPFIVLFAPFIIELLSSFLQILSKKYLHRKLFPIAPIHHLCEYYGMKEYTVVMKFRLIQWILGLVTLIMIFYALKI